MVDKKEGHATHFSIELAASPESRHTISFASDMAAKVKTQQAAQQQQDAVFLERRRLIRAKAPAAWETIRAWFERTVAEFNREVGSELLSFAPADALTLRLLYTPPGRVQTGMDLRFEPEAGEIDVDNRRQGYRAQLPFHLDGDRLHLEGFTGNHCTLEESCEEILKLLVD